MARKRRKPVRDIQAINLGKQILLLDDGKIVPVIAMFDSNGQNTDEPDEAVSFVGGVVGEWFVGKVSDYEPATTQ